MAISMTALAGAADITDASSYTTASFTPTADSLVVAYFAMRVNTGTAPTVTSVSTTTGLTFVEITNVGYHSNASPQLRVYAFRALKSSGLSAGTATFNLSGTSLSGIWSIMEYSGVDTTGTDGSGAIVQSPTNFSDAGGTSGSVTLAAAGSANNRPSSVFHHRANEATTHQTNWTEIHDVSSSAPFNSMDSQWRSDAFDTAAGASWTTDSDWGGIAIEIKEAVVGGLSIPIAAYHYNHHLGSMT